MCKLQPDTQNGKKIVAGWLAEAQKVAAATCQATGSHLSALNWGAAIDVHVQMAHQPRCLFATVQELQQTGMAFRCRELLATFSDVVICLAGRTEGVRAKVVDKKQTIGGYIYSVRFEFDLPARKASTIVAA